MRKYKIRQLDFHDVASVRCKSAQTGTLATFTIILENITGSIKLKTSQLFSYILAQYQQRNVRGLQLLSLGRWQDDTQSIIMTSVGCC